MTGWLAAALLGLSLAQEPTPGWLARVDVGGEAGVMVDTLPRQDSAELRPTLAVDVEVELSRAVRVRADVLVRGLVARRYGESRADAIVRPRDVWVEVTGRRAELRAGYGQVAWGRLDEIQPTDVINPLDATTFLLEGRANARLPVAFARGRLFVSDELVIEGVLVPAFRRGRFDELDETHSPFNLLRREPDPAAATGQGIAHAEPTGWARVSGGGRVTATVGRVDVSMAAYRGNDAFGPVIFEPALLPASSAQADVPVPSLTIPGRFVERHERFTMIGGDFETVVGQWGWRGEVAAFVQKALAAESRPGLVRGRIVEAGVGFDRQAGALRVYGSVFGRRAWSAEDVAVDRTDVSVVGSAERSFSRERFLVRVFALANPADESGFVRGLFSSRVRDNVVIDLSAGAFLGSGDDTLSRFAERDFVFARFRYYF